MEAAATLWLHSPPSPGISSVDRIPVSKSANKVLPMEGSQLDMCVIITTF